MSITRAIETLARRQDLAPLAAADAMGEIMDGQATPGQIAGFLAALATKGERAAEIGGLASAMRARAVALPVRWDASIDLCGTGGDSAGTFNISSVASLVCAACGARVAKHGNRAASSACGSADLFEQLGVRVSMTPTEVCRAVDQAGIGFLFAPAFHPSMRHAAPVRRELGIRTAFNILGPLTNPASPTHQLLGVSRPELTDLVAQALVILGCQRAWVVHGADGLDELSPAGYTKVSECRGRGVRTFYVHPSDFGLPTCNRGALAGGDVVRNAEIAREVLEGRPGPPRDAVVLNAAAALLVAGIEASPVAAAGRAAAAIDDGSALGVLEKLIAASHGAIRMES
jgi:anthranilate phosphoribosyltransferase